MKRIADLVHPIREHAAEAGLAGRIGPRAMVPGQHRLTGEPPASRARVDPRSLRFRAEDLLFCTLRPASHRLVLATHPGSCTPEILVLRPRACAGRAFAALAHRRTVQGAARLALGTRMPRIRWADLADLPVPELISAETAELIEALLYKLHVLHARDAAETAWLRAEGGHAAQVRPGPRIRDIARHRPANLARGSLQPSDPVVRARDLETGRLAIHRRGGQVPSGSCARLTRGDVLLLRLRPGKTRVGVAPVAAAATAEILALEVDPAWRSAVLAWLLQARTGAHLARLATGTRVPRLPLDAVLDARIPDRALPQLDPVVARAARSPHLAAALRQALDALLHGESGVGHPVASG